MNAVADESPPHDDRLTGLHADSVIAERLNQYARAVLDRNASLNLTGARDGAAVAAHVHDSLSLLPFVREPLVDVGSGAGFPGLPLAIVTGYRVTLIESTAKKARFLEEIVAALGLEVRVLCARAETAARDPALRGSFASATARALGSLPAVLELTLPFLEIGGVALLQRGRLDDGERVAGAEAARLLGGTELEETPLDGARRIVLVRKLAATHDRFPRRSGVPQKRPLAQATRGLERPPQGDDDGA